MGNILPSPHLPSWESLFTVVSLPHILWLLLWSQVFRWRTARATEPGALLHRSGFGEVTWFTCLVGLRPKRYIFGDVESSQVLCPQEGRLWARGKSLITWLCTHVYIAMWTRTWSWGRASHWLWNGTNVFLEAHPWALLTGIKEAPKTPGDLVWRDVSRMDTLQKNRLWITSRANHVNPTDVYLQPSSPLNLQIT